MKVLGISAYFHDAAAALVVDGVVVAAAQEERFSRQKHDARVPVLAARFCLEEAGLTMADVDHVVFYEKPLQKFDRILVQGLRHFPRSLPQLTGALRTWLTDRLWLKADLCRKLGCSPQQLLFTEHHLSHAASSFLTSPHQRAAILTVDGVGEWTTTAIHHGITDGNGTHITPIKELHFPHSIGLLYSAITAYLGFEVNEGEYKVMGLASYGEPTFLEQFNQLARVDDDGALTLDLQYFRFHTHTHQSFSPALEQLLGPARQPGARLDLPPLRDEDTRFANIAASLQRFTQDYLITLARHAREVTGEDVLCLAGGVALNCVANQHIAAAGLFGAVVAPPAPGDAGGAVGAALWVTHGIHGLPRSTTATSPFLGKAWPGQGISRTLDHWRVAHERFDGDAALFGAVAERLARGEVGGFHRGRFEWGPRALGARSILADARDAGMKERINRKIKFREPFRPFAPAVLAQDAQKFFEPGNGADDALTPLMLTVREVTPLGRQTLPSITHVDGTARVQVVEEGVHPDLFALLTAFRARTGVGALLNTSLNLKDEPLASSPAESYAVFARSDLDFLVLENCLITRTEAA